MADLSKIYDTLYDKAGEILREHNPCKIEKGPDGRVTCVKTRSFKQDYDPKGELCCSGCRYLGPDGCTTKSLGCRVGACTNLGHGGHWPVEVYSKLQLVASEARAAGIPLYFRHSKEEHLSGRVDRLYRF